MPIRRNPETIIKTLVERIAKAKSSAPKLDGSSNTISPKDEFDKIEKELEDMTSLFPIVKSWEEIVVKEFDDLEQDIAGDESFDNLNEEKMKEKFQSMNEKIEKIKAMNSKIELQSVIHNNNSGKPLPGKLASKDWKMSSDWQQLSIEKQVLVDPVMKILQVSYDDLELQSKVCFLCFSIFPRKSFIKKRPLIYWWIGEGLITNEKVGEDVLEELLKKGMINPVRKKRRPMVSCFTIHPWIRLMVISVAKKAGFIDFDETGKLVEGNSFNSRRMFFQSPVSGLNNNLPGKSATNDSTSKQFVMYQTKTIFNVNQKYLDIEPEFLMKHPMLDVLQLGRWQSSTSHHIEVEQTEFLEHLGDQMRLRYLSFRGISDITYLPKSIAKLIRLQILDLRACHNLKKLPAEIKAMKKLTHLDVSQCYILEEMPKGLQALTDLQVLKGFVIASSRSKDPCRLKDLFNLKMLRKLSLIIGSDAIVDEKDLLELQKFEKLRILSVTWGGVVIKSVSEDAAAAKHGKEAARTESKTLERAGTIMTTTSYLSMPNLEKLDLRCFPKKETPHWLNPDELPELKRLYIRGGKLCSLGDNGNGTWKVKVLRFKYLKDFRMEWLQLHECFPDLEYLETKKCDKLDYSFQCDDEGTWVKGD